MAGELQAYLETGLTLYATLISATGTFWNGAALEAFDADSWTDYDIALTEQSTTGIYLGNMPAADAGVYAYVVYEQAGVDPAVTDAVRGNGNLEWDGSAVLPLSVIEAQTDDIGTAGAGLTAVPWNAAWDAEVESEASDALIALNLDHLAKTATAAADMTTEVSDNTILARILANGDTSAFDPSTDGLTLIHDDLATVDGNVDSILADTGTDGVLLADDAITSDVFDESTAYPQTTADTTPMVLP